MKISLIGMSNSGKTFWSKKLEERGFQRFSCDDFIEAKLSKELKLQGFSGIKDVAKWMGQPYDGRYKFASRKYLEFERESMRKIIKKLNNGVGDNVVVDTTGSVIYTGDDVMQVLKRQTIVVYLFTPKEVVEKMYQSYLQNPKPVFWGDIFAVNNGELPTNALTRCYPLLLEYRSKQYQKFAHVTVDYTLLKAANFQVDNFIKLL